jgi:hypothetical protein
VAWPGLTTWPKPKQLPQSVLYVPVSATDPPTLTPTEIPGYVPVIIDPVNHALWEWFNNVWNLLGGGSDPDQGLPTNVYWCENEEELPPANAEERRSFAMVMDTPADSPGIYACNGFAWTPWAYLNAAPRLHGDEAHTTPGGGSTTTVRKPKNGNEQYASTLLHTDADLQFPVAAGEKWWFDLFLFYDGASTPGQGDITWLFAAPNGSTGRYGYAAGPDVNTTGLGDTTHWRAGFSESFDGSTNPLNNGTAGVGTAIFPMHIFGWVLAADAGTLRFRWAQRQASATATTVKSNSMLVGTLL